MTTETQDIREQVPGGMVSVKEFLDAARAIVEYHDWCETAESLIFRATGIDFKPRGWDCEKDRPQNPCLTPQDHVPEFVSVASLTRLARDIKRHGYWTDFRDVRELLARFGVPVTPTFNDTWKVTLTVTSADMEDVGYNISECESETEIRSFLRAMVLQKARRHEYATEYVPDSKRPEPTGPNVSDEDTYGSNAVE